MLVLIKERVYLRQEYLLCEGRMRGKAKSRNRNFRKGWKRKLTHLLTYIFVIPSFRIYTWKKKKKTQTTEFSSTLPPAPHKLQWNVSHIQVSDHKQGWLWHLGMWEVTVGMVRVPECVSELSLWDRATISPDITNPAPNVAPHMLLVMGANWERGEWRM